VTSEADNIALVHDRLYHLALSSEATAVAAKMATEECRKPWKNSPLVTLFRKLGLATEAWIESLSGCTNYLSNLLPL
jgi:hypothetical protein